MNILFNFIIFIVWLSCEQKKKKIINKYIMIYDILLKKSYVRHCVSFIRTKTIYHNLLNL